MKKRLILVPFFMVAMTGASPSGMEPMKPLKPEPVKEITVSDKMESINLSIQDANKLDYKP